MNATTKRVRFCHVSVLWRYIPALCTDKQLPSLYDVLFHLLLRLLSVHFSDFLLTYWTLTPKTPPRVSFSVRIPASLPVSLLWM